MIALTLLASALIGVQAQAADGPADRSRPATLVHMSISSTDFPTEPFAAGIEGDATIRYVVGPNGRVSDCYVERTTGSEVYGAFACELWYMRARFRPARDAAGRPTSETRHQVHVWRFDREDETFPPEVIVVTVPRCLSPSNVSAADLRCRRGPPRTR